MKILRNAKVTSVEINALRRRVGWEKDNKIKKMLKKSYSYFPVGEREWPEDDSRAIVEIARREGQVVKL